MEPELRVQVERADDLADELGTEIRGEHLLDAMAQLGLFLDAYVGPWPAARAPGQLTHADALAHLLPELDPDAIMAALDALGLLFVPAAEGRPNVAATAWMALLDAERERRDA